MKIAIIGSGISGLGAAYFLHPQHDITLFEKNDYLGGHSRTIDVVTDHQPAFPVDTGFIVFNHKNYPMLTRLFQHLGVDIVKSNMSFGANIAQGWLQYRSKQLFRQKRNLMRPRYWKMLYDVLRFNTQSRDTLPSDDISLQDYCDQLGIGSWFQEYYFQAMMAAIWSCSLDNIKQLPARLALQFADNHGLLQLRDRPQWWSLRGGSRAYVQRMCAPFADKIHLRTPIRKVERREDSCLLHLHTGEQQSYDQVIFACHANSALRLLDTPSKQERQYLGAFAYSRNNIVVHGDTSLLPKNRQLWASWNYDAATQLHAHTPNKTALHYWMNNLQSLPTSKPIFCTLNPYKDPAAEHVYDQVAFAHPIIDAKAVRAQQGLIEMMGAQRSWYCGAYLGYGFHEDGLTSAARVATQLGAVLPWSNHP